MNPNVKTDTDFSTGIRKDGTVITVDLNKCISAGPCAIAAPLAFLIRPEDGKAIIGDPDGDSMEMIMEAARSCPILAISIKKQTGQQVFP